MNKEIIIKDQAIYYRVIGEGPVVVLVHGFGEDGEIWKNQVAFLKASFKLVIPDLPGSGRSGMVDDMTMEGMAEIIKAIIDKETSPAHDNSRVKVALVGHSMGGYIALAFAEKYAGRLNSFGLFHSTAMADSEEKKATRKKGIEFIEQHGAFEFLKTTTPNLFSPRTRDERPELIDEQINSLRNFSSIVLVSYYEAMMIRPDRQDILKNLGVPVLFLLGEHDNAVPLSDGLKQCHLPQKSYIHILTKSGHMGMLEEANTSNRLLGEFLKRATTNSAPSYQ